MPVLLIVPAQVESVVAVMVKLTGVEELLSIVPEPLREPTVSELPSSCSVAPAATEIGPIPRALLLPMATVPPSIEVPPL